MAIIEDMGVDSLPDYTAIIPTYNRKDWVLEAVRSVMSQTHGPHEILVVDDGSTDDTVKALEGWPVRVITQGNAGPSSARNHGTHLAKSEWVAFLDSDDLWEKDKLRVQMEYALSNPEFPLIHTGESWIRNGTPLKQKKHHRKEGGWLYRRSLELCLISPSSVLMKKSFFLEMGGFDENLPAAEDYDLWLRICLEHPVGFIEDPLTIKRGGHGDQLSAQRGIDQYRVVALEKMMAHPRLLEEDRRLTYENLLERYRRLVIGFKKHGKPEAQHFEQRLKHWKENF
jgi:glycosyltransferase involved in cell wall biosynthesis